MLGVFATVALPSDYRGVAHLSEGPPERPSSKGLEVIAPIESKKGGVLTFLLTTVTSFPKVFV